VFYFKIKNFFVNREDYKVLKKQKAAFFRELGEDSLRRLKLAF
jgi:hypothetical protein